MRSAKHFDTRENPTPAQRPALLVEFTPPPPCSGDANHDGAVDFADINFALANWLNPFNFHDITDTVANWQGACP